MTDHARSVLSRKIDAYFDSWLERAQRVVVPMMVPPTHFSVVLAEVRECFIYGQFSAAITTSQAVAEGMAKFAAERHSAPARFHMDERRRSINGQWVHRSPAMERIDWLEHETDIELVCIEAFRRIHGAHRNDFHHMNRAAPTLNRQQLEGIAEQCVRDLQTIEGWFFALTVPKPGTVAPVRPRYWPEGSRPGTIHMMISLDYPPPDMAALQQLAEGES